MAQIISWINVLNDESLWHGRPDMRQWLAAIFDSTIQFTEADLDLFEECLANMRRTIDAIHFGDEPEMRWLDDELAAIKLTVQYESFLPDSFRHVLPLLHAQVKSNSGKDLLKALSQTLLIPFADFVARAKADKQAPSIARCVGLFRENNQSEPSIVRSISAQAELKWREEIDFLKQNDLIASNTVQRCADIFIASPKAKFCSDACRFTTFQLVKQMKDPRYHAEKQKKYRTKLADK